MVAGSWLNADNLFLQYGTQKANPSSGGDYLSYGETREMEFTLLLANLTTTAAVQEITAAFPVSTAAFIEQVELDTEVGMTASGATAFSVGLGYFTPGTTTYISVGPYSFPAVTSISDTAFVNGALNAVVTTAGQKTVYAQGTSAAGGYIGVAFGGYIGNNQATSANKAWVTAKSVGGTYSAGQVKVRIKYRGVGTITQ